MTPSVWSFATTDSRNYTLFPTASIILIENSRSEVARERLNGILDLDRPFVLHVGSNLRRKNREGVLRSFGLTKNDWNGQLVLAGDPLNNELHSLGESLGILDRIVEVIKS